MVTFSRRKKQKRKNIAVKNVDLMLSKEETKREQKMIQNTIEYVDIVIGNLLFILQLKINVVQ